MILIIPLANALEGVEILAPKTIYATYFITNDSGDYSYNYTLAFDLSQLPESSDTNAVCIMCQPNNETETRGVIIRPDWFLLSISELLSAIGL